MGVCEVTPGTKKELTPPRSPRADPGGNHPILKLIQSHSHRTLYVQSLCPSVRCRAAFPFQRCSHSLAASIPVRTCVRVTFTFSRHVCRLQLRPRKFTFRIQRVRRSKASDKELEIKKKDLRIRDLEVGI